MPYRLVKKKIFPNVHVLENKFRLCVDNGVNKNGTMYPVIMQDEGKGDPNSKYTNPESGSFSESAEPNCYPDSRVNYARVDFEISLTKEAVQTDKVEVMKIMMFPIYTAFLENLTATNDATSEEVEDLLELQHETSDRQVYPLWNGTDLGADSTQGDLATNVPGLTTDQGIEGVDFDINKIYDCLQYYTNGKKLKRSIGKIRTLFVTKNRTLRVSFRIKGKTKAINPYTFFGVGIHAPTDASFLSTAKGGDLTTVDHLTVLVHARYNEWNENFNFMR